MFLPPAAATALTPSSATQHVALGATGDGRGPGPAWTTRTRATLSARAAGLRRKGRSGVSIITTGTPSPRQGIATFRTFGGYGLSCRGPSGHECGGWYPGGARLAARAWPPATAVVGGPESRSCRVTTRSCRDSRRLRSWARRDDHLAPRGPAARRRSSDRRSDRSRCG